MARRARRATLNCAWIDPSGRPTQPGGVAPSIVNLPGRARHMHFRANPGCTLVLRRRLKPYDKTRRLEPSQHSSLKAAICQEEFWGLVAFGSTDVCF